MSMDTGREEMTQAVLEGVAFALRDSLEVAKSLGIHLERTKICGGGAKSALWKRIIANVMNLKVDVIASEEGPGLGGAILAAVGCGEFADVEEAAAKLVRVDGHRRARAGAGRKIRRAVRKIPEAVPGIEKKHF